MSRRTPEAINCSLKAVVEACVCSWFCEECEIEELSVSTDFSMGKFCMPRSGVFGAALKSVSSKVVAEPADR